MSALNETGMDLEMRLDLYRLHQELSSKNETTANLASGTAMLFVSGASCASPHGRVVRANCSCVIFYSEHVGGF